MIYTFILIDQPGAADLRATKRQEHKDYLGRMADRIAFAGPFLGADGQIMIGSLLAIDFASHEAAAAWLDEEPFTRAGLYASRTILAFQNLWPQKAGFPPA